MRADSLPCFAVMTGTENRITGNGKKRMLLTEFNFQEKTCPSGGMDVFS